MSNSLDPDRVRCVQRSATDDTIDSGRQRVKLAADKMSKILAS